ncbi:MAG: LysR family transcriptional regulator [Gammaproteobacteria bacterium]
MDIDLLKTFLEVNKTRHFGRAADHLFLTPAAVSARVRQLEQYLGAELFIRSRNNIQLTPEGERLVPHAETLLLAWSRARQDVVLPSDQHSQLSIAAPYSCWQFGLQGTLGALYGLLPDVALRTEAHPADVLNRMLLERTLDLALLLEPPVLAGFKADRIGQVKLVLVSSDPNATLKTAMQDSYVMVDWGVSFELFHAKRYGDACAPVLHTNMGTIALDYLQHQPGAAYLPQSVLARSGGEGLKVVKGAPAFTRPLYGVYRTASDRRDTISRVLTQLRPLDI